MRIRLVALWLSACLVVPMAGRAQGEPRAAVTFCVDSPTPHPVTRYALETKLDSLFLREAQVHEGVHQRQIWRQIWETGHCPILTRMQLLEHEVEAYMVSDIVGLQTMRILYPGESPVFYHLVANAQYDYSLLRLLIQFDGQLYNHTVIRAWLVWHVVPFYIQVTS